jgi:pimeloyl-ACP methyl ester carboxylesterase
MAEKTIDPPRALSKRLALQDVELHYLDYGGDGPPCMLLVHGAGAHVHWFDFVGPPLAALGRVLAVDLRGHGDSTWANPPLYTIDAYLEDLRRLLRAERFVSPVLIGHSMGGLLALSYAANQPHKVGALIVCDTRMGYSEETAERLRQIGHRRGREYASQKDFISHFQVRPEGLQAPDDVRRYVAAWAGKRLPDGSWAHKLDRRVYAQRQAVDTFSLWPKVTCPTLLIHARSSNRLPSEILSRIRKVCPQTESIAITGSGHHLMLDRPDAFVEAIRVFLQHHHLLSDE